MNLANGYKITYKEPAPIGMGDYGSIKFKVILEGLEEETWFESNSVRLMFNLTSENSWAMILQNHSLEYTYQDMIWRREKSLWIKSNVLGVDMLNITSMIVDQRTGNNAEVTGNHSTGDPSTSLPVIAIIANRMLNNLFTGVILRQ